jgi:hypothetical protein
MRPPKEYISKRGLYGYITLTLTLRVDSWSNESVVRQPPAGKNVSTEAEDIVGICQQATNAEDIAN